MNNIVNTTNYLLNISSRSSPTMVLDVVFERASLKMFMKALFPFYWWAYKGSKGQDT